MKKHKIKEDRPGYRFLTDGPTTLPDSQLLAVFAGGTPGNVDTMREALAERRGLRPLIDALHEKTVRRPVHSINTRTIEKIRAAIELARRYLELQVREAPPLANPDQTKTYTRAWLCRHPHEVFACLFLDNRHRIIKSEILFTGTIDGASVYPREVVKRCLELNASAIILAHNHPSGIAEPSQADRNITMQLTQTLALLDVRVLDHLVVGDKIVTSMAERGLLY